MRAELIESKGYRCEELPSNETLRNRLNTLGYYPSKVENASSKKIALTDAIFDQLGRVYEEVENDPTILRLSLDSKAAVKVGPFSRGGKTRTDTQGCDHDFKPKASVVPYGIFLPQWDEVFLYLSTSKVTSDFMVDMLESWRGVNRQRFPQIQTLLLHQDNGPENHSRRTQFMHRLVVLSNHQNQFASSLLSAVPQQVQPS